MTARKNINEDINPVDVIKLDVPFFIRLMELAREDLNNDLVIHDITQKLIELSQSGKVLNMECYTEIENIVKKYNHSSSADEMHEMMKKLGIKL